ncbi:MAG: DUF692 domain-containing protein [Verrucomicrobia bacterium]|nr:MAG: DUF692 domain-containing protein [Verrucomicrobiota bacterium]
MHLFPQLHGLGIGWRPEVAHLVENRPDLTFVEVVSENLDSKKPLPLPIQQLRERGLAVIPHGVSLSLGGAERIRLKGVEHLARLAEKLGSPLVSEHIAFVRAGGVEIGHLTPLPRTQEALEILVENVEAAKKHLPVPLALENIAALLDWPDNEMSESQFVTQVLELTNCPLLLDLSNVYANAHNRHVDPRSEMLKLPLARTAYVHMGGGIEHDGIIHDTHAAPLLPGALELLRNFCEIKTSPSVMLERDEHFPSAEDIHAELDRIKEAMASGPAYAR